VSTQPTLPRRAAAEAVGTFGLVFAGCGAVVTDAQRHGALGVVGIGLVFFLVLVAAIATLGHVSGAHFNPGVSLSFFLTGHLPARDLAAYWAASSPAPPSPRCSCWSSGRVTPPTSARRSPASLWVAPSSSSSS
jgi:hypothetical protein